MAGGHEHEVMVQAAVREGLGGEKLWVGLGSGALAAIAAFVAVALAMLLASGGVDSSWPPLAYLGRVTLFTLGQAVASTVLSVVLALPVALAIGRRPSFPGRRLLLGLMLLPLGLPVLPAVFGIVEIWGRQGIVNQTARALGLGDVVSVYGLTGILIGHVFFNLPLAARLMVRALEGVPESQWKLAAILDFPRLSIFRFIEWPALARVIPGIAGLLFMLCVTSFTIVLTLGGGPQTSTLEVAIYQALKFDFDPPRALALSALQLVLTLAVFLMLRAFPDPEEDRAATRGKAFRPDAAAPGAWTTDALILALFLVFVGSPIVAVVVSGLAANLGHLLADPLFRRALVTSIGIAACAGFLCTLASFFVLRAAHAVGKRQLGAVFRLPQFMLLLPPLTLGSGWFILLLRAGLEEHAAVPVVIVINMLMAMPFAMRVIAPELDTHLLRTRRLAESLDIHGWPRYRLIDLPVLRGPLLIAFSFAMALSLGDLGAIALFGSDNFITLPSLLYAKLGSYRTTDAAGLALILGVLCLIFMLPAIRGDRRAGERP